MTVKTIPLTTNKGDSITLEPQLYISFELSNTKWKLMFSIGLGQKARERTITAGDLGKLTEEIAKAKERFKLPETAQVVSCYEAGRDGFWLHRYLVSQGIINYVVDPGSIQGKSRGKNAKTDRIDAQTLLTMLIRYHLFGDKKVWSVVNVPSEEMEENRRLHRELEVLKHERTGHVNRIKGYLAGVGIKLEITTEFVNELEEIRLWNGNPLPEALKEQLKREYQRWSQVNQQIKELEKQRKERVQTSEDPIIRKVRELYRFKGIGHVSSWVLVMEFFGWRDFKNRKEPGALAGLTPTPSQSGNSSKEQGISKAGNKYIRGLMIELAWGWLRYQPGSKISRWFQERFAKGSKRTRKIGIVAVARKLLVALWRYVDKGIMPEGADLKA